MSSVRYFRYLQCLEADAPGRLAAALHSGGGGSEHAWSVSNNLHGARLKAKHRTAGRSPLLAGPTTLHRRAARSQCSSRSQRHHCCQVRKRTSPPLPANTSPTGLLQDARLRLTETESLVDRASKYLCIFKYVVFIIIINFIYKTHFLLIHYESIPVN